jgi:two-component system response regulator RegA
MSDHNKPAVLVIDDDERFRARLCQAFELRGWEAFGAADGAAAQALAVEVAPDLALVDLKMASESGLDIVRHLRDLDATVSIVMLTGYGSIATAIEAIKCGADHYLSKPVDVEQILSAFETLHDRARAGLRPPMTVPTLARVEWEHIQRVLADCGGNVSQCAKLLGMHRRSLQRKLAKYPPRD